MSPLHLFAMLGWASSIIFFFGWFGEREASKYLLLQSNRYRLAGIAFRKDVSELLDRRSGATAIRMMQVYDRSRAILTMDRKGLRLLEEDLDRNEQIKT